MPFQALWQPGCGIRQLQQRAALLAQLREFFAKRGVLEVETPALMATAATEPTIAPLWTEYQGATQQRLFLQSSPEFAMKRLLAAGCGAIYQICRAFRDGEAGRWHNPEFTLLEWYRPGFDHHALMREVEALLCTTLGCPAADYVTYSEAFARYAQLDPLHAPLAHLQARVAHWMGATSASSLERDACLQLIMNQAVEPHLGRTAPTFVYHYPASQAALARRLPEQPELAARFEVYVQGVELANGFYELTDAAEQRERFEQELAYRRRQGMPMPPLDEALLAALAAGLPDCAGVALGVDRLLMLQTGATNMDEVLAFSLQRLGC